MSLDDLLCPEGLCPAMVDGIPTHRDTNHLSVAYARHIAESLDEYMQGRGVFLARGKVVTTTMLGSG
jgi:hypothetical protein